MRKARQSTEKPFVDEMRIINGVVKVWTGTEWITEKEWDRINCPQPVEHLSTPLECLKKFADRFEGSNDPLFLEAKSIIEKEANQTASFT